MADDKVAGSIGVKSLDDIKTEKYKQTALISDDAIWVQSDMAFYVHGKHRQLAGVEGVIKMNLTDILALTAGACGTTLMQMALAAQQQAAASKKPKVQS